MCVWVCVCVCVNIYADTDLYTAYMPRGGSMHGDRGKEVALHHPSRTQPSLLPRADPVSTISGLRRPRQGGRCSAPGEWVPLRSAGWNALRKPWTALESKHLLRLRWASFAGSLEVGPSVRGIIFFFFPKPLSLDGIATTDLRPEVCSTYRMFQGFSWDPRGSHSAMYAQSKGPMRLE